MIKILVLLSGLIVVIGNPIAAASKLHYIKDFLAIFIFESFYNFMFYLILDMIIFLGFNSKIFLNQK